MMIDNHDSSNDESELDLGSLAILNSVLFIGLILLLLSTSLGEGCQYNFKTASKYARLANISSKILFWLPECPVNEDAGSTKEP